MSVYLWWSILLLYSIGSVLIVYLNPYDIYTRIYITACAIRSIWLRQDGTRICLFDTWISYPFVGRSLATVAEICFAYQLSLVIKNPIVFYLGIIAQFFCWHGVITLSNQSHIYEETIWLIIGLLCAYSTRGLFRLLFIGYCLFMIGVDIPMYYDRYKKDELNSKQYLGWDGIYDMMKCNINDTYEAWKYDMAWMTGYFIFATQFSMFMCRSHYSLTKTSRV